MSKDHREGPAHQYYSKNHCKLSVPRLVQSRVQKNLVQRMLVKDMFRDLIDELALENIGNDPRIRDNKGDL